MRVSAVLDGDAAKKIEGIVEGDRGLAHSMTCKWLVPIISCGPGGMIIVVVDANRECNLSGVRDGWIYRFCSCTGRG